MPVGTGPQQECSRFLLVTLRVATETTDPTSPDPYSYAQKESFLCYRHRLSLTRNGMGHFLPGSPQSQGLLG